MSTFKAKVPVFDGKDFHKWKFRLTLVMRLNNCEKVITLEERPENITADSWLEMQVKATNIIISSVNNTQINLLMNIEDPKEMLQKLQNIYAVKSESSRLNTKRKILDLRLKDNENPVKFINKFETLMNELRDSGETVSDEQKLQYLLLALPKSLNHIIDLMDNIPEENKNAEFLKNKIISIHQRDAHKSDESSYTDELSNQFSAMQVSNKNRGKRGFHRYRNECNRSRNSSSFKGDSSANNNWRKSNAQNWRGKGNGQNYHPHNSYRGRNFHSRGYRGNRRNFRQRGNQNNWKNLYTNFQSSFPQRDTESHNSNLRYNDNYNYYNYSNDWCTENGNGTTSNHRPSNSFSFYSCNKPEITHNFFSNVDHKKNKSVQFLLDSGCTDHIINDESLFSEFVTLEEPNAITVGDGYALTATKVGNINLECNVNNTIYNIKISNVYFVQQMKVNLLSVSIITDLGHSIIFKMTKH